jgi:hypothetical protein
MTTKQRIGNAPGQGRQPTIVKPGERSAVLHARVSPAQRAKVERNGGAQWVRALIDAAPETHLHDALESHKRMAFIESHVLSVGMMGNGYWEVKTRTEWISRKTLGECIDELLKNGSEPTETGNC